MQPTDRPDLRVPPPRRPRGGHRAPGTLALLGLALLALTGCADGTEERSDPPPVTEVDPSPEPGDPSASEEGETAGDGTPGTDDRDAPPEDDGEDRSSDPDAQPPVDPDLTVALQLTEVASMRSPTAGATGPDGTLYLAERAGTVHPLTSEGLGPAVVDISAETTVESERGLLGLAFAADGSALYLSSTGPEGATVVTEVAVADGEVQAAQRRTLFTLEQPYANHNGGDVHIGPDGFLYLGLGDGGGAGDPLEAGQDLSTPLGSLLRIDPQGGDPYAVPSTNPFLDTDGAAPEIVAYGLRNPWRFAFDPVTDEIWIADVGQNTREEINRLAFDELPGANLGWNLMEGTSTFAGSPPADHVPPVYEYRSGGPEGCAVTGGVVYRGAAIEELTGVYLYADYCNGAIRGLVVDDDGEVVEQADLGVDGGAVVAFATDTRGEVYVLDLEGAVLRVDPA